ncbi:MAG: Fur family transcriptional regulator [Hyphomicrobiales bacterium]|nr:Fur family transcriptional regulator [Hyphomicrobiales bacterium]
MAQPHEAGPEPANRLFPPIAHNHGVCLERALARARAVCEARGVRFTELRERVFRQIASSHKPLGAYDIIEQLAGGGKRLAPISVYRIIEVLEAAGLVHRLESRNAYFACHADHARRSSSIVLLCEACGRVAEAEAPGAQEAIASVTAVSGFEVADAVLEVKGRCGDCREGDSR